MGSSWIYIAPSCSLPNCRIGAASDWLEALVPEPLLGNRPRASHPTIDCVGRAREHDAPACLSVVVCHDDEPYLERSALTESCNAARHEKRPAVPFEPNRSDPTIDSVPEKTEARISISPPPDSGLGFARGDAIDRFIVVDFLGRGAMGVVVKAYDPDLDRIVAIKVLRSDLIQDSEASTLGRQRLFREAQAMAKLSHPNVVTVHEVGTMGDRVFLVMEYVEGQTLGAWLKAAPRTWREVIGVFSKQDAGWQPLTQPGSFIAISSRTTFWFARMEGLW